MSKIAVAGGPIGFVLSAGGTWATGNPLVGLALTVSFCAGCLWAVYVLVAE